MEANNIILVGMMGAGKSSVANELGKLVVSYRVVDVDKSRKIPFQNADSKF